MYICFSASPVAPRWAKITYLPARHFARLITRTQCASHHSFRNTLVRLLLLKSTVHVLSNRHTHALAPSEKWLPTTINFAFLNTPWLSPTLSLTHEPPPPCQAASNIPVHCRTSSSLSNTCATSPTFRILHLPTSASYCVYVYAYIHMPGDYLDVFLATVLPQSSRRAILPYGDRWVKLGKWNTEKTAFQVTQAYDKSRWNPPRPWGRG